MFAAERTQTGIVGRISLARIDSVVSARLGPSRVRGNAKPAVFNRQVAMYLAKHVGGWSTTAIGRFYIGRDHSTVCYSIKRVGSQREREPELARLIEELTAAIIPPSCSPSPEGSRTPVMEAASGCKASLDEAMLNALADRITARVLAHVVDHLRIAAATTNVSY
jgi:hypothetical protein